MLRQTASHSLQSDRSPTTSADDAHSLQALEAARFALLLRVAPALRHGLMGQMQGFQFLGELLARHLRPGRNPADAAATLAKMPEQTATAVARCHALTRWIKPHEADAVALDAVVHDVHDVVDTELSLRGIQLQVDALPEGRVERQPTTELLTAAVLLLADTTPGGADFTLRTVPARDMLAVTLARDHLREADLPPVRAYRSLTPADLAALATAAGARFAVTTNHVQLQVRWLV